MPASTHAITESVDVYRSQSLARKKNSRRLEA